MSSSIPALRFATEVLESDATYIPTDPISPKSHTCPLKPIATRKTSPQEVVDGSTEQRSIVKVPSIHSLMTPHEIIDPCFAGGSLDKTIAATTIPLQQLAQLYQELQAKTRIEMSYIPMIIPNPESATVAPKRSIVWTDKHEVMAANYVADEILPKIFIASEYPKNASQFWKFALEFHTDIIDLSGLPNQYTPSDDEKKRQVAFGISVFCLKKIHDSPEQSLAIYRVSTTSKQADLYRFCYKKWAQYSVISLSKLYELLTLFETRFSKNILVHSLSGVGRTGVLLTAYFMKQRLLRHAIDESALPKTLHTLLIHLRQQRGATFVETEEQFMLLLEFTYDFFRKLHRPPLISAPISPVTAPLKPIFDYMKDPETLTPKTPRAIDPHRLQFPFKKQTEYLKKYPLYEYKNRMWTEDPLVSIIGIEDSFIKICEQILLELFPCKIRFESKTRTIHFGYGPTVIKALASRSRALEKIIGYGYNTIFEEYNSPLVSKFICMTPSSTTEETLKNAYEYFHSVTVPAKSAITIRAISSEKQLIEYCLQRFPGICLGEYSLGIAAKSFLFDNMQLLVKNGVTTLLFEHIPTETLQKEIDFFMSSISYLEMSFPLSTYLDYISQAHCIQNPLYSYKNIFIQAKKAGIKRILCIDTEETSTIETNIRTGYTNPSQRIVALNYAAVQLLQKFPKKEKFLLLSGAIHCSTFDDIPGISELTGGISICVKEATVLKGAIIETATELIEKNPFTETQKHQLFDIYIRRFCFTTPL